MYQYGLERHPKIKQKEFQALRPASKKERKLTVIYLNDLS